MSFDWKAKYEEFLNSPEWQQKRNIVIERNRIYYNGCCERCLENEACDVHHKTYKYGWNPPIKHLQMLCRECHKFIHRKSDFDPLGHLSLKEIDQRYKDVWSQALGTQQDDTEEIPLFSELYKRIQKL